MLDVFLHCIYALHVATLAVLDFVQRNVLHNACPSWRPTLLALPLPAPTLVPSHWLWQWWLSVRPSIFHGIAGWFPQLFSFFGKQREEQQPLSAPTAVASDANDWTLCKWLSMAPESSDYSTVRQMYFLTQLTMLCVLLYPTLLFTQYTLRCVWPSFAKLSFNSQRYVVLNLAKAAMLACAACSVTWLNGVQQVLLQGGHNASSSLVSLTITIIQSTIFYVVIDLLAIFMVPKLPRSTTIHHVGTVAFAFLVAALDVQRVDTARMILIYGSLSTVAYLVNAFLAVNKVYCDNQTMLNRRRLRYLAAFALLIYAVECAFNWSLQATWYFGKVSLVFAEQDYSPIVVPTIYVVVMIGSFVRDDLILASSLWRSANGVRKNAAPTPPAAQSPMQKVIESMAEVESSETMSRQ